MRGDSGVPLPIPEEEPATGLTSDSIPLTMFSCPGAAGFKVRGHTYLQDKKKVWALPGTQHAHLCPCILVSRRRRNQLPACRNTGGWLLMHFLPSALGCWILVDANPLLGVGKTCLLPPNLHARLRMRVSCRSTSGKLPSRMQVLPDAPVCRLVSLNLLQLEKPTFHIAPYLPSVKASKSPLLFIWHVRTP